MRNRAGSEPSLAEAVAAARERHWTDADILYRMTLNKPRSERRELVKKLAPALGLSESEALEIAKAHAIV